MWVAAVGLLLLGAQVYDWWLQVTLPLWLQALAGLGLAMLSSSPAPRSPAEVSYATSPQSVTSPRPNPTTSPTAQLAQSTETDSISFTLKTPPLEVSKRDRA
ncbi:MAG: hypothetical protein ACPGVO_09500 [Spirulinaceae cyanobacterium]